VILRESVACPVSVWPREAHFGGAVTDAISASAALTFFRHRHQQRLGLANGHSVVRASLVGSLFQGQGCRVVIEAAGDDSAWRLRTNDQALARNAMPETGLSLTQDGVLLDAHFSLLLTAHFAIPLLAAIFDGSGVELEHKFRSTDSVFQQFAARLISH